MTKYRKKPIVVDAVQLSSSPGKHGPCIVEWEEVEAKFQKKPRIVQAIGNNVNGSFECICFNITTLEGTMTALPGDWIITGVKGEIYPCKPDVFEATYESVS